MKYITQGSNGSGKTTPAARTAIRRPRHRRHRPGPQADPGDAPGGIAIIGDYPRRRRSDHRRSGPDQDPSRGQGRRGAGWRGPDVKAVGLEGARCQCPSTYAQGSKANGGTTRPSGHAAGSPKHIQERDGGKPVEENQRPTSTAPSPGSGERPRRTARRSATSTGRRPRRTSRPSSRARPGPRTDHPRVDDIAAFKGPARRLPTARPGSPAPDRGPGSRGRQYPNILPRSQPGTTRTRRTSASPTRTTRTLQDPPSPSPATSTADTLRSPGQGGAGNPAKGRTRAREAAKRRRTTPPRATRRRPEPHDPRGVRPLQGGYSGPSTATSRRLPGRTGRTARNGRATRSPPSAAPRFRGFRPSKAQGQIPAAPLVGGGRPGNGDRPPPHPLPRRPGRHGTGQRPAGAIRGLDRQQGTTSPRSPARSRRTRKLIEPKPSQHGRPGLRRNLRTAAAREPARGPRFEARDIEHTPSSTSKRTTDEGKKPAGAPRRKATTLAGSKPRRRTIPAASTNWRPGSGRCRVQLHPRAARGPQHAFEAREKSPGRRRSSPWGRRVQRHLPGTAPQAGRAGAGRLLADHGDVKVQFEGQRFARATSGSAAASPSPTSTTPVHHAKRPQPPPTPRRGPGRADAEKSKAKSSAEAVTNSVTTVRNNETGPRRSSSPAPSRLKSPSRAIAPDPRTERRLNGAPPANRFRVLRRTGNVIFKLTDKVIKARNVQQALPGGPLDRSFEGVRRDSRNGPA